jgi:hypothetical protein
LESVKMASLVSKNVVDALWILLLITTIYFCNKWCITITKGFQIVWVWREKLEYNLLMGDR